MKVVIINGRERSGKDTFVDICSIVNNGKVISTSMVDGTKELARKIGWDGSKEPRDRKFLSDLKDLLDEYKDRILNVHASILPKYRGASPIQASLYNGDKETGVSIMLVDEGMDTGDVLSICKLEIRPEDTSISLAERLSELGGPCLVDVIENFDMLYANRIIQDESQSSHVGFISKEMGLIDFDEKASDILNKHRAFYAWPKLYFTYKGENVKVHDLELGPRIDGYDNGQIIKVNDQGVFVNCEDGCLIFTELQFPGKKKMKISDYLRGNEIELIRLNEA